MHTITKETGTVPILQQKILQSGTIINTYKTKRRKEKMDALRMPTHARNNTRPDQMGTNKKKNTTQEQQTPESTNTKIAIENQAPQQRKKRQQEQEQKLNKKIKLNVTQGNNNTKTNNTPKQTH